MARQSKLQNDYFADSGAGSSKSQSQSQGQKLRGRFKRHQSDSDEAEGIDGYGSEGSAGMAAIRLSRSQPKVKSRSKASNTKPEQLKPSTSKPVNLENDDSDDDIVALSPVKLAQVVSRDAEDVVEDLVSHGPDMVLATSPPSQHISLAPRKRVSLASSSRQRVPPVMVPVPNTYTRIKTADTNSKSSGKPAAKAPTEGLPKSVPIVELESWPLSRKASYPIYNPRTPTAENSLRPSSSRAVTQTKAPRAWTPLARTPSPEVVEISDDEPLPSVHTPAKRQRFLVVEIPASQHSPSARKTAAEKGKAKMPVPVAVTKPVSRTAKKRLEGLLDEIELDEPKRFKSQSRLRAKTETAFQRKLRKMKNKREGIIEVDTETESEEEDDETETDTSDSAADSRSEGFIEDDGGIVADGVLPHEFSLSSAQTPEWKFKVVFHYFVMLAVRGVEVLPLKGDMKAYMMPQIENLRRKMDGLRDQRVRGQIWPHHLVDALKTHPDLQVASLEFPEEHCVACNRHNFTSRFRIDLRGKNYDRDTFKAITKTTKRAKRKEARKRRPISRASSQGSDDDLDNSSSSSSSESDSEGEGGKRNPEFFLGVHCKKKVQLYHEMTHWELRLYYRVRQQCNDLLRALKKPVVDDSEASSSESDDDEDQVDKMVRRDQRKMKRLATKRRIQRIKTQGPLPNLGKERDYVDNIQAWMDDNDHILEEFKWMDDLQEQSRRIEFERSRDE